MVRSLADRTFQLSAELDRRLVLQVIDLIAVDGLLLELLHQPTAGFVVHKVEIAINTHDPALCKAHVALRQYGYGKFDIESSS